jgi:hypothetical protein
VGAAFGQTARYTVPVGARELAAGPRGRSPRAAAASADEHCAAALGWYEEGNLGLAIEETRQALGLWPEYEEVGHRVGAGRAATSVRATLRGRGAPACAGDAPEHAGSTR